MQIIATLQELDTCAVTTGDIDCGSKKTKFEVFPATALNSSVSTQRIQPERCSGISQGVDSLTGSILQAG